MSRDSAHVSNDDSNNNNNNINNDSTSEEATNVAQATVLDGSLTFA